ncbi:uncharacterized protein [Lepeophtheirus salmonis]|uniref:uncharacterized protein n=1 Tax=Lepeophtheirus salmonis TaxID=72036 RepID=UPI001AE8F508|nr:transcription factor SPT20 homolog [Lepeophtheirus salmonis]
MSQLWEGLLSWADATLERAEGGSCDGEEESMTITTEEEDGPRRSLEERLLRLHVRESLKEDRVCSHVNPCRNLLDNLLRSDPSLSRLLLTLGPDGLICLKTFVKGKETLLLGGLTPDDPLLNYFESQELPPILLDLLEPKLWMEGCVLAEVRRCSSFKTLLLRPSTQSIICDSNLISCGWSPEEKLSLEGELALLLSGPLCLDPNPVVSLVARKSLLSRQKLNTVPLRRIHRKRRWQKESPASPLPHHSLLDFINSQRSAKGGLSPEETLAKHQASVRASIRNVSLFSHPTPSQAPPTYTDVSKRARTIQKRAEINDMTPHVVEEYILETAERSMARVYHTRLTIYQRLANDEYLGELYVERDYRENENKGSTCRFVLGTQPHALRYINQFTEIFTEEGRKSVKITHRVPNQPPRVTYTPGMRERLNERDKILVKSSSNAVFNAIPKQAVQPQTRIIQFNNPSSVTNSAQQNNQNNNNNVATPSILQTQLQRTTTTTVFPDENNSTVQASLATQQQQQKDMEISAIKQALMKESAEFEANKSSKTFAQLPTRPVPQASLADSNTINTPTIKAQPSNPKLVSKQLSLHKILNAQAVQQQQIQIATNSVKVSPISAQLSRPVISGTLTQASLPSYSQAQQNSIKSKLVVTPSQTKIGGIKTLSHDAPGLQALLANTPSADSPAAVSVGSTLLERLVSGQAIVTTSAAVTATPTPLTASSTDSTNDITLAALLAKPAATGGVTTSQTTIYSTKMSPLLQQLQQPAQPVRTSVRQSPLLSPRLISSSPRPQQQQFSTSQTPVIGHSKSLSTVPTSSMITLPVQEAVNGFSDGSSVQAQQSTQQTTNVVSLQNLLQSGVVNNSGGIATSSSSSIPVQLSIQGLPSPVTLSVNLSDGTNNTDSVSSSPNVYVTHSAGNVIAQGQQKVNLPKIVSSGNQTVLFQSPGNIIQLPQQTSSLANIKPVVTSQIKTVTSGSPLLQVRPGQPVFLQVPNSQNKNTGQIQIVRTQSIVRPSTGGIQSSGQSQQVVINSLKSPVVNAISPQQVGLLSPSSSSIPASPQQLNESNLVAIQLQQQQQQLPSPASQEHQQLILAAAPQKQGISQIKVRQQRKQTLK